MATICKIPSAALVERLTSAADLLPLRAQWNQLARGVPFRSYEWLESWWRTYGSDGPKELFVLCVTDDDGRLLGLAPWFSERDRLGRRVVQFLGSGEVCSDYLTILARPGHEPLVAETLAGWMTRSAQRDACQRWDVLRLGSVHPYDATLRPFVDTLAERGLLVRRRERPSCWRVALPSCWEEYLATLSKSHRKQIRRLDRKYFDGHRAHLHIAQTSQQLDYGLEVLRRLHQRRRESLGDRGCFASPRFATFHAETALRLLRAGQLRLVWLDVDGRTVAAEYQVLGDGVVYAYQSGIEPASLVHEPGRLITLATIKLAIAEGSHAFDFLRGDETYKAHWRAQPRPTQEVRVAVDTPSERLLGQLWSAGGRVRSWLRARATRCTAACFAPSD